MNKAPKKIAVIFNTNQLGGGERSLIEQLCLIKDNHDFTFLLPNISSDSQAIIDFLKDKGFHRIDKYIYPAFYYQLSRRDYHKLPLIVILLPCLIFSLMNWHLKFNRFSYFYINGNKAAFPLFIWLTLFNKKRNLIWHFRDFPSATAFKVISKLVDLFLKRNNKIKLIANSNAVQLEIARYFKNYNIQTIYNLAGDIKKKNTNKKIETIGVVSMLAPWKGIHEVVLMSSLYQDQLKELKIKKINFYGENIYHTKGEHVSYADQLLKLSNKLNIDFIEWRGKKNPQTIFNEIDLLIHSSIKPEPFGRVIIEAQKAAIPVISTGLGGAGELVDGRARGLLYLKQDYTDLFQKISTLVTNPSLVDQITQSAYNHCLKLESKIQNQVLSLFE